MRSISTAVAVLALATLGAAPVPKGAPEALYFPTTPGTKLVYEVRSKEIKAESTHTVTKVEAKGDALRVTVDCDGASVAVTEVSARGHVQLTYESRELAFPRVMLKLPATPGDTWARKASDGVGAATFTVGLEEEVVVPAGKYRAIPVECRPADGERGVACTSWYAPGVGLVKCVVGAKGGELTLSLKSFTPGK